MSVPLKAFEGTGTSSVKSLRAARHLRRSDFMLGFDSVFFFVVVVVVVSTHQKPHV